MGIMKLTHLKGGVRLQCLELFSEPWLEGAILGESVLINVLSEFSEPLLALQDGPWGAHIPVAGPPPCKDSREMRAREQLEEFNCPHPPIPSPCWLALAQVLWPGQCPCTAQG